MVVAVVPSHMHLAKTPREWNFGPNPGKALTRTERHLPLLLLVVTVLGMTLAVGQHRAQDNLHNTS